MQSEVTHEAGHAERVVKIVHLLTALYSPEEAAQWLRTPQALLDEARPVELFGSDAGEARLIEVLQRITIAVHR